MLKKYPIRANETMIENSSFNRNLLYICKEKNVDFDKEISNFKNNIGF